MQFLFPYLSHAHINTVPLGKHLKTFLKSKVNIMTPNKWNTPETKGDIPPRKSESAGLFIIYLLIKAGVWGVPLFLSRRA